MHVVRIEEYCVPKRGLVRALSDGLSDRILHGDVDDVRFGPAEGDAAVAVTAVDVEVRATGRTVTLTPASVIAATGTGTRSFVGSIVDGPSFGDAAGGTADRSRGTIREQLTRITHERAHMICIRGPKDVLPGASVLFAAQHIIVVSADVDAAHDRAGGERRTWYVTPQTPEPEHVEDVPGSARAEPDPARVAYGIEAVMEACPPLRGTLDGLEFGVYAGYKQNVGDSRGTRLCEPVEGVSNLILALPSLIGGAWLNARSAVGMVEETLDPGAIEAIPGAGEGVRIGDVIERTDGFEWLSWDAFREAFPGVDG